MSDPRFRPTWVEVDLDAVRHNVAVLTPPAAQVMAVLKADAYGHGAVAVAAAALQAGATWCGVALVEEGLELRAGGIEAPILVLSEFPPGAEAVALAHRLTPSLYSSDGLTRLAAVARGGAGVHVKVDTGMHRVGVWPPDGLVAYLEGVDAAGLRVEGIWTHLAKSEDDTETTRAQLARYEEALATAEAAGFGPAILRHAANSGAVLRHPEAAYDLVRPGIALYGIAPDPGIRVDLRPALTWRSAVSFARRLPVGERLSYGHRYELARDAMVATVPVGYADGYPRALSSKADVLIRGTRCRVAGNVTMDQLLVDCGDLDVQAGDDVVLLGSQGGEEVAAWELAAHADTNAYEIVTRIGQRVPRTYLGAKA
ncbi:MAG: alanine racemase [Actinomycetota bacterium]